MSRKTKDPYRNYVEHPHFGRGPRFTGSNPSVFDTDVSLRSGTISTKEWDIRHRGKRFNHNLKDLDDSEIPRIPNTAIIADPSKQPQNSYWRVTHYFDLDKVCLDCNRPFLFFAEEQRYWFEELGISLDAQALRCCDCRKKVRDTVLMLKNYDHLLHVEPRTQAQNLALAEILLTLIEAGTFPATKTAQVRAQLNMAAKQSVAPYEANTDADRASLLQRVLAIETGVIAAKQQ